MAQLKFSIINGPNLNLLGTREPDIYGTFSLADIETLCRDKAKHLDVSIDFMQSNYEGALVEAIQQAGTNSDGILINAAAYTHTSIAIHDALGAAKLPTIEVHLSNIFRREEFRHTSFVSAYANGVICGFGPTGYEFGLVQLKSLAEAAKNH